MYILVSQGIEILRTEDLNYATKILNANNKKWLEYCEKCNEEFEVPADNEMFLYEE